MKEVIDIVNEKDEVIGQEFKSEVHKNKCLHRNSKILIFKDNSYQEILLEQRSLKKKRFPGKFCLPGGHVDKGETYLYAAKREESEEILNNKKTKSDFEPLFKIESDLDDECQFIEVFMTIDSGPFIPDKLETEKCFFININELLKDVNTNPNKYKNNTKKIIEEYKKRFLK